VERALRIVAIGCGRVFARYHLPALRAAAGVALAGASDAGRRAALAAALGDIPCHASLDALLEAVDADAALVATPPASHAAIARACLARGLAVLVEKPLALGVAEAAEVLEAERRSGRPVRVGFNRRFRAGYARLRERAATQGIEEVAFTFLADAGRWNPTSSGEPALEDVLHDTASHAVDLVAFMSGRRLLEVRAAAERGGGGSCRIGIEARLDGGGIARCTVGHAARYDERLAVRARGRARRVEISGRGPWGRLVGSAGSALRRLAGRPSPAEASFRAQLVAFARTCRGEPEPVGAGAAAGLAAVAAVAACGESLARDGAWCEIAERHG
jgi:predicted dehydrogenase